MQRLIDALEGAEWPERRRLMATWVAARILPPDPLVVAAAQGLSATGSRVSEVARDLGISERGLYRRTTAAVGLGPKTLARILRLHRLAQPTTASLAERALAAGYASQAHMSDEVRRLTGQTAVRFLEDRSQMSI
ncbi:MAG: helix-turn-helix domain-containing protein [Actinomycetota bacterium]|nr:helix-turn-helix domain-containing protein [Actinomycetota bacterium]